MKTFKDIKIGDTVYLYGKLEHVRKITVTYKDEFVAIDDPCSLYRIGYDYFGSKPELYEDSIQANCRLNDTRSSFGCFAATVYFNQEDVIEQLNKDIETLERYKQEFINIIGK